jgi:acetyltransferase-like isoleucine patch superfamily enzyme
LEYTEGYHKTSTVENLKKKSVCLALTQKYFDVVVKASSDVYTIVPVGAIDFGPSLSIMARVRPLVVEKALDMFVNFHNHVNEKRDPPLVQWGKGGRHNPTSVLGVDGMRYIREGLRFTHMKHMGTVVIGDRVDIGANTVIHRGVIDDTTIGNDTKIGSNVSIAHNCRIGSRVMITSGSIIAGSVTIGHGCWLGVGTIIRDHIKICKGVRTGAGSVVVKNITEPGTYFGNPAVKMGEYNGEL